MKKNLTFSILCLPKHTDMNLNSEIIYLVIFNIEYTY